jgi:hypothetical protein
MKKWLGGPAVGVALLLTGCTEPPYSEGPVVDKFFEPGSSYPKIDDPDWVIIIETRNSKERKEVAKKFWEKTEIGDYLYFRSGP